VTAMSEPETETAPAASPIERCLERWHRYLGGDRGGLDDLLHDDVTFWSPIVFSPQQGKELTTLYLTAAGSTLGGGGGGSSAGGGFRYVRTVREGNHAVLEFETTMDGTYVNGVDLITCDDDGRIVDFKVMIRPLRAINAVHEQMRQMLERMQSG
jgi:hypothetical protein